MILVTGATGTVGGQVARALAYIPEARFRALVRRPEAVEQLRAEGIDSVLGDFSDAASMQNALQDVERLFLVSTPGPSQVELEGKVTAAAQAASVQHIVKLSVLDAEREADCAFLRWNRASEKQIEASGVPYTFLRPNGFMENLLGYAPTVASQSTLYAPAGDAAISFVDVADIAAVAARVLTEEGHTGKAYNITGPEAVTHQQIAALLSGLLGREVTYVAVDDETARQTLTGFGMPEWQAEGVVALYRLYRQGYGSVVSDAVPKITGRPAHTVEQYLRDHLSAFQQS